ncbi:MAG: hypothetical protein H6667_20870 [Ardenticatenaceae bacterium]|nr:hypothetical protein [Ardenticatenaceae bacterium]MCB9446462.1 hypothetical protein [Ardenticatenaceae bacterium]
MNLINLELGKWLYLIIYIFFPAITLLYLIRTFGLEMKEDIVQSVQYHLEQADYWAETALKMAHSPMVTKSMSSLIYTVQHHLDEADRLLETAVLTKNQHLTLNLFRSIATHKLALLLHSQNDGFCHDEPVTFVTRA